MSTKQGNGRPYNVAHRSFMRQLSTAFHCAGRFHHTPLEISSAQTRSFRTKCTIQSTHSWSVSLFLVDSATIYILKITRQQTSPLFRRHKATFNSILLKSIENAIPLSSVSLCRLHTFEPILSGQMRGFAVLAAFAAIIQAFPLDGIIPGSKHIPRTIQHATRKPTTPHKFELLCLRLAWKTLLVNACHFPEALKLIYRYSTALEWPRSVASWYSSMTNASN